MSKIKAELFSTVYRCNICQECYHDTNNLSYHLKTQHLEESLSFLGPLYSTKEQKTEHVAGIKHDQGKPKLTMVPLALKEQVARVMEYGAQKYARDNYKGGFPYTRIVDATMRHLEAFVDGQDIDPESGLPHLAHAAASIGMLLECMRLGTATDDRYKK